MNEALIDNQTHRMDQGWRAPDRELQIMKEPGLDSRHRDKNRSKAGRIQQKRSDALNNNLPKPIPQFSPNTTLGKMRAKTGKVGKA
jgi:hypothetical protein